MSNESTQDLDQGQDAPLFDFWNVDHFKGTLLENIPLDLHPTIHSFTKRARPIIKKQYKSINFFGNFGDADKQSQLPIKVSSLGRGPCGLAIDGKGNLFISCKDSNEIQVFQQDGTFLRSFANQQNLQSPAGLVLNDDGELVVVDRNHHRIQTYDPVSGEVKRSFGNRTILDHPACVTLDNEGNLVVSDCWNSKIRVFTAEGHFLRSFGKEGRAVGKLSFPVGLAVDLDGTYIVCENGNSRIQLFTPEGDSIRAFGCRGEEDGEFSDPWGIAVDRDCKIIVADHGNRRLQIFSKEGQFLMKIGGKHDPDLTLFPQVPVLDQNGNLIITESTGQIGRIRVLG